MAKSNGKNSSKAGATAPTPTTGDQSVSIALAVAPTAPTGETTAPTAPAESRESGTVLMVEQIRRAGEDAVAARRVSLLFDCDETGAALGDRKGVKCLAEVLYGTSGIDATIRAMVPGVSADDFDRLRRRVTYLRTCGRAQLGIKAPSGRRGRKAGENDENKAGESADKAGESNGTRPVTASDVAAFIVAKWPTWAESERNAVANAVAMCIAGAPATVDAVATVGR